MARGPGPDWRREETAFKPVWDLGELAARAAQGVGIDRAGQVAFSTSFEQGSASEFLGQAAGGSIAGDNTNSSRGAYSLKLTTAATINSPCICERFWFPLEDQKPIGIEVAVDLNGQDDCDFDLGLTIALGPQLFLSREFRMRIQLATAIGQRIQYRDQNFVYQDLVAAPWLFKGPRYWHSFKMVVNPWTGKYVRAIIDYLRIDMGNLLPKTTTSILNFYFDGYFCLTNRAAAAKTVFVDDVLLTGNEPA